MIEFNYSIDIDKGLPNLYYLRSIEAMLRTRVSSLQQLYYGYVEEHNLAVL